MGTTPTKASGYDSGDRSNAIGPLPRSVWVLGFVSLLMDTSSELVHSLLPIYMVSVLGASMSTVGVIEGIAEATAAITKVFSGAVSDYVRRRKLLAVMGYGLAALTKPMFPLAHSVAWVFVGRFVDRVGKGIRGAPRDALVADVTPIGMRGRAYGLRQSLDSVGAVLGPLLAVVFMIVLAQNIKSVLWIAVAPAFLAVALLIVGIREPSAERGAIDDREAEATKSTGRLSWSKVWDLPATYWWVVALAAVFSLARFSEAFLILRADDVGLRIGYVPLVMIVMNIIYSLAAYPAGVVADRYPVRRLLVLGLGALVVADILLAIGGQSWLVVCGAGFWGLHLGLTQGLFSKWVAETAPACLRGTAFGVFNLVGGGALLLASVIAGAIWSQLGGAAPFLVGASLATMTACGLFVFDSPSSSIQTESDAESTC